MTPEHIRAMITVRVELTQNVAWITLDRESTANARNQAMRDELSQVYQWAKRTEDVACVVLTGAGERFFCAGMDLKEAGHPETPGDRRRRMRSARDIDQLANLPVPTIAAINGFAVGGGLEMALACDFRIAVKTAKVGLPEVTHGLIPGGGGTQRLPRLIGSARAAHLVLTGDLVDARRGQAMGLLDDVVRADELRSRVTTLASTLASRPRTAMRAAKEALRAAQELPLSAGLEKELDGLLFLMMEQHSP